MPKIEMTINNPYVSRSLRASRYPTVFRRVMSILSEEKKNPGKIIPLFVIIENEYKIFGALTLNSGGSVSFFPDFYELHQFDHLTLNGNFIEKKGHLTKIEIDGKRKKPIHLLATKLETGDYHLITFIMKDSDSLMDAPPIIDYAVIEYENEEENKLFNQWINESVTAGHAKIDFPNEQGSYCIQIQIIDKLNPSPSPAIESSSIEDFLADNISLKDTIFNARRIEIPTLDKCDYNVCIFSFKIPYKLKNEFAFVINRDPLKPISPDIATKK